MPTLSLTLGCHAAVEFRFKKMMMVSKVKGVLLTMMTSIKYSDCPLWQPQTLQQFKNFKKHNSLPYLYYSLRALLSGRMQRNHPRMPQGWTRTGIPVAEPDLFATFMRILAASLAMEVVSPGDSTRHCTYLKTPGLGWHFASPPLNPILTEEIESIGTGSDYTTD